MTEEPGKKKKVFLSDWELKKMDAAGREAAGLPENAIISPLSREWMDYDRQPHAAGDRSQVTGHRSQAGGK